MEWKLNEVIQFIRTYTTVEPSIGIILGSGLGTLAEEIKNPIHLPYEDIPHFPVSTVTGHKGQFVIGELEDSNIIAMQGRLHFYEGYPIKEVTYPITVMKALGIQTIVLTNAAGGINPSFSAGDLMLITDHVNLIKSEQLQENVGMSSPIYTPYLLDLAERVAREQQLQLKRGVYAAVAGPSYETPAEIHMLKKLGVDAVGMSTAPEAVEAFQQNIQVIGISCISNMAAGVLPQPLSHEEVIATTEKVKATFSTFTKQIIKEIARKDG